MNLRHRQEEISKIDLKLDSIQHDLTSITTSLGEQIKWIENDENNIKAQIHELQAELKHSDDYFNNKMLEKRKAIEEKYAKKPLQQSPSKNKMDIFNQTKESQSTKKSDPKFDDYEVENKFSGVESGKDLPSSHQKLNQSGSNFSEKRQNNPYDHNDSINLEGQHLGYNSKNDLNSVTRGRDEGNNSKGNFNSGGELNNSKGNFNSGAELNNSKGNFNSGEQNNSVRGSKENLGSFYGSKDNQMSGQSAAFGNVNQAEYNSGQNSKENLHLGEQSGMYDSKTNIKNMTPGNKSGMLGVPEGKDVMNQSNASKSNFSFAGQGSETNKNSNAGEHVGEHHTPGEH
jgi:hypothetical protein